MIKKTSLLFATLIFTLFLNAEEIKEMNSGTITVKTIPAGLNVYVDGKKAGVSPLLNFKVPPGNRMVSIEVEPCFKSVLFYSWNRSVFVEAARETVVEITPEPVMTSLKISSMEISGKEIKGHPVFVDGKKVGTQPGDFEVPVCSKLMEITDASSNRVIYSSELDLLKGKIIERKEKGYEIIMSEPAKKDDTVKTLSPGQVSAFKYPEKSKPDLFIKLEKKERKITGPYKWIGTGLIISGAVVAGLGGVFDYLAYKEFDEYEKMGSPDRLSEIISTGEFNKASYLIKRDDHYQLGKKYAVARTIMYAAGGASFLTGFILLFVPGKNKTENGPVITAYPINEGVFINTSINF